MCLQMVFCLRNGVCFQWLLIFYSRIGSFSFILSEDEDWDLYCTSFFCFSQTTSESHLFIHFSWLLTQYFSREIISISSISALLSSIPSANSKSS